MKFVLPTAISLIAGLVANASSPFLPEGGQYKPVGSVVGDQVAPVMSFRSTGGWLAWQDNSTDGDGFGISIRRLTGQLTGLSSFRVNEKGLGDQENAQLVQMADGGALIVWQSGKRGAQSIVGRVIKADGRFAGPEFFISNESGDQRDPAVAMNVAGAILVVWASEGVDGNMLGIEARKLTASGALDGDSFVVNQYSKFHQRSPSVAAVSDGSFVVSWISEHQRGENAVDVFARRISAAGQPFQEEFPVNVSQRPCATPAVSALGDGGFLVAWSEHDHTNPGVVWDVVTRPFGSTGALASPAVINTRRNGFQGLPKIASAGDSALVVYRSQEGDGFGDAAVGRWVGSNGQPTSEEFVVNTQTAGDQLTPSVAADGKDRVVALWSTFGGSSKGMDLAAQRFVRAALPLEAPAAPYVFAASASRLLVSFPELSGLEVQQYELYVDGSESPVTTSSGSYSVAGLAPNSTHSVRLAYKLNDGRRSPLSQAAIAKTWGEDLNADGLPDDWQAQVYGGNSATWPSPSVDTDGDGVSDRDEFLAGTDAKMASSVLKTFLTSTQQGVNLRWNSRPGAFYQVQVSSNLKDWNNLGSLRFAAGENDSIPVGDQPNNSYYRVNLLR